MNKNLFKINNIFILIYEFALIVFVFTIFDILFNKDWIIILISSYIVLFLILVILLIFFYRTKFTPALSIEEFEKTLKGGLFHFKCQICGGIFAIKKSRANNKKKVKMNCPDCGAMGIIPENPLCIEEDIPEKKSTKAVFRCKICGEGVTIWAEGSDLYSNTQVFTCPFCGVEKPLHRF